MTDPLIAVVGETASGKSALAMELAERFNGELICADSWTVYKGFDIGTAKPSAEDQKRVRHHLLDIADPATGFNAVRFQAAATEAIADITSRKRLPILVGGTGLYIDSVLFGYKFLPPTSKSMRAELDNMTIPELLEKIDKMGLDARGIDIRNKRRIVRHIENGGVMPSRAGLRGNTLVIGTHISRENLLGRVTARVDAMLQAGLEDELRVLLHFGWDIEPMKGIGYREWRDFFAAERAAHMADQATMPNRQPAQHPEQPGGHVDVSTSWANWQDHERAAQLAQVRERIIKATMDLAKRQRTWFKRHECIQWVNDRSNAVEIVTTFLNKSN